MLGVALGQLAPLLAGVHVADQAVLGRRSGDRLDPVGWDRANAVDRDADADTPLRRRAHARSRRRAQGTSSTSGSQKRRWPGSGRAPGAAAVVGRGQQHDLQSACQGRLRQRDRHRVGLGVGRPVRLVNDVVKLAHRAIAGGRHLAVDSLADGAHRVRVMAAGEPVHLVAPAPEVIAGVRPLADPAQVELERVAVGVGHRGNRRAPHRSLTRPRASSRT